MQQDNDDVVLLVRSREVACAATKAYMEVESCLGLTVSLPKEAYGHWFWCV